MLLHLQRSSVHFRHVRYCYHVLTEIFHCAMTAYRTQREDIGI